MIKKLKVKLKEKIDKEKDVNYHNLQSLEMRNITTEILKKDDFHIFDEPFTGSEGKKQPDAIAVGDRKVIVIEYVPQADLSHEAKMEKLLETKDLFQRISGKEVEFWLVTTRISEPKMANLKGKGVKVFMPTPSGTWTDEAFLSQYCSNKQA